MKGILSSIGISIGNSDEPKNSDEEQRQGKIVIFIAEVVGTATLMFFGCMGCITQMVSLPVLPHLPALTFGLTVMTVIQVVGHISGAHLNPQVSIGAVILGKLDLISLPIYLVAETIGAILGIGLLKVLTPSDYQTDMCMTLIHEKLNLYQAVFVEVIITGILLMVCGAVWDPRNARNTDSTAIRFGLYIALASMVAGPYTGASMNSVRTLAPAIFNNNWTDHWVYWVGPTCGAILGSSLYRLVFGVPKTAAS